MNRESYLENEHTLCIKNIKPFSVAKDTFWDSDKSTCKLHDKRNEILVCKVLSITHDSATF